MEKNPYQINNIETERLILIPFTTQICNEILANKFNTIENLELKRGKNWPDHEMMETLPKILFNLSKVNSPTGFESWMIIKKDTNEIIGDVGFKGYNTIFHKADIGYGIIEAERKKGYASEAVKGLINWAFTSENLELITATTLINNTDSIKLLEILHFNQIEQEDNFFYWELTKEDFHVNYK